MTKLVLIGFCIFTTNVFSQVDLAFYKVHTRVGSNQFYPAGLEYYTIPEKQIAPIRFSAEFSNNSGNIATNTYLAVEVFKDGVLDNTFYSDSADICAYCVDSLYIATNYLPDGGTDYTFNYYLYTDQPESNISDNDYSRELKIDYNSWSTYRRDEGQYVTYISDNPWYPGEAAEFGNVFEIFADDNICKIAMYISPWAGNVGDFVYGMVYRLDTASGEFWAQNISDDYQITSADLGEYVTVNLLNMDVDSGDVITVMACHYGLDMMTRFGQSQQAPFGSVIGFCFGSIFAPSNYRTLMVYPVFNDNTNCDVGIQEQPKLNFIFFPIAPNPATDRVNLHFKLHQNSAIQFYLRDIQGKIIRNISVGEQSAGEHSFNLELDNISAGIYYVSIQTDQGSQTQKLIINE